MAGPFEAFIHAKLQFATISTVQVVDSSESLLASENICLNFLSLLCVDSHFIFPSDLRLKIKRASLKPDCNLIRKRTLKNYFDDDKAAVKKIMVEEKKFLDKRNKDLPSGTIIDDLVDHIWSVFWKSRQISKKKK